MELDGKMSVDAKLFSKFITQQVADAKAKKRKQYENKIKNLEKGGKEGVSGEEKNGTRGGVRDSKKNKKPTTQTTTKFNKPKQYASSSEQGRNSILRNPSRERNHGSGDTDSGTPGNGLGRKAERSKIASALTNQISKTDVAKA